MAITINQTLDSFFINYNIRSKDFKKIRKHILKNKSKRVKFKKQKKKE